MKCQIRNKAQGPQRVTGSGKANVRDWSAVPQIARFSARVAATAFASGMRVAPVVRCTTPECDTLMGCAIQTYEVQGYQNRWIFSDKTKRQPYGVHYTGSASRLFTQSEGAAL